MKKLILSLFLGLAAFTGAAQADEIEAAALTCPSPSEIHCVPTVSALAGWTHNGSQTTGNNFAPNSQCANVISLNSNTQRLFCCYTKCGVFIRDVRAQRCQKMGLSRFSCN